MLGKRHIILFCLFALVLFSACKTKLTQFNISYDTTLKSQFTNGNLASFISEEMQTDCRVKFEHNDTKRSKVKRIHLKKLSFSADSEKSLMFLVKNLKNIYISSPNYAEQKISFRKLVSRNISDVLQVEVQGSKMDLIDFIKQERFSMRFEFEKTSDFPEYLQMYVDIELFVEGELIKTNLYHKILV